MDKVIKRKIPIKIVISVSVFVVVSFIWITSNKSTGFATSAALDGRRIVISSVSQSDFEEYIPLRANVESSRSVFIDAVEGGRVDKILIEEGTRVKAGDVLLTLTNTRLQLDVIGREALATEQLNNLRNTQLSLDQNSLDLKEELIEINYQIVTTSRKIKNAKPLLESKVLATNDFEELEEQVDYWKQRKALIKERMDQDKLMRSRREEQLTSSIGQLVENLKVARSVLGHLEIKAPNDGVLTSLNVELGESKSPGENLGIVDSYGEFKANARVSEFYLDKVIVGQTAALAISNENYTLQVQKVFPEVEGSQFEVEFKFIDKTPDNLRRGQSVPLKLQISSASDALVLDSGPFLNDTNGSWVFVLGEDGRTAEKRKVILGRRTPSKVEVIDGLKIGDRVITSTYKSYLDADRVNIEGV